MHINISNNKDQNDLRTALCLYNILSSVWWLRGKVRQEVVSFWDNFLSKAYKMAIEKAALLKSQTAHLPEVQKGEHGTGLQETVGVTNATILRHKQPPLLCVFLYYDWFSCGFIFVEKQNVFPALWEASLRHSERMCLILFFVKLLKRKCLAAIIQTGWNCSQMCPETHTLDNECKAHPNW